jgi:hypothetical protein
MERLRCAHCGNVLSVPLRQVGVPEPPPATVLGYLHPNPPLLEPGTYAIGDDVYILSPGDVRGTQYVHELVEICCCALCGGQPCMACERCGAVTAGRVDDCYEAQEARFPFAMVTREALDEQAPDDRDPFAAVADWDQAPPETRDSIWVPVPVRPRPELVATRWRTRGLKSQTYRDDPPA